MSVDYYAILGVPTAASQEDIRRAYHKLAFAAHPDRGGSHRQMQRINEAWEVLGHAEKRRAYDLERQPPPRPSPRPARPARPGKPRPARAAGPRPPSLAQIAGSLLARAFHALGGWPEHKPQAKRKPPRGRAGMIVRCRRCGQKLRVPPQDVASIRCPKCRHSEVIR